MSMRWVRELVQVELGAPSARGLDALAAVIGRATGMPGVIFWENAELDGVSVPCVVTAWYDGGDRSDRGQPTADPATLAAFRERTLVLPDRHARPADHPAVAAALPVDWADAGPGAVTLLGGDHPTQETLDILTHLVDLLPPVCDAVRRRQTLALVNACNELLREADIASRAGPVEGGQFDLLLTRLCRVIAEDLGFAEVSILLHEPGSDRAVGERRGDRGHLVVPIACGGERWGTIECARACRHSFHRGDLGPSLLVPVAAQIALYWSHWLHRQEISNENRSWRSLASGVTRLNEEIRAQLGGRRSRREPVYEAALRVIRTVVPDCRAAHVGAGQRGEPDEGWAVAIPIRVRDAAYAVLDAAGPGDTVPPNAAQVCQIIADQLGLYHFLRETLENLHHTQRTLRQTVTSQAMALEDIKHQLVSPLVAATMKTEGVLQRGRFDSRTDVNLRAVRGLCRRAGRVALSAGVFSMLNKGQLPSPKPDFLGLDDLLRLLILAADDAQVLIDDRRKIRIEVERASFQDVHRRLIRVDRSFLEQCVGNLLDNAAKYSYDGTTVGIHGTVAEGSLEIGVSSQGIPIPPGDIERCLHRNWRGRAARTATGEGSGLGLWIVDNLVRSMNGAVDIDVAGDGTKVVLRLPFA